MANATGAAGKINAGDAVLRVLEQWECPAFTAFQAALSIR